MKEITISAHRVCKRLPFGEILLTTGKIVFVTRKRKFHGTRVYSKKLLVDSLRVNYNTKFYVIVL